MECLVIADISQAGEEIALCFWTDYCLMRIHNKSRGNDDNEYYCMSMVDGLNMKDLFALKTILWRDSHALSPLVFFCTYKPNEFQSFKACQKMFAKFSAAIWRINCLGIPSPVKVRNQRAIRAAETVRYA